MGDTTVMKQLDLELDWIPTNPEEANKKFIEIYGHRANATALIEIMNNILSIRMKQGEEFISAYKNTLYDYLKTPESERNKDLT